MGAVEHGHVAPLDSHAERLLYGPGPLSRVTCSRLASMETSAESRKRLGGWVQNPITRNRRSIVLRCFNGLNSQEPLLYKGFFSLHHQVNHVFQGL